MEKNKDTAFVLNKLNNSSSLSQGLKVISDNEEVFVKKTFSAYFNDYLAAHREMKPSEIIELSGLNRTYAYDVLTGKRNASRDRIIALCFASKMNLEETNHALIYAGHNALYARDRRDACIILAINRLQQGSVDFKNVADLNWFLDDQDQDPLDI